MAPPSARPSSPERTSGGYVGADEFEYEAFARSASDKQVRLKVRINVTVTVQ